MSGAAVAWGRVLKASLVKNWRLSISYPTWLANRLLSPLVWVAISVYAYVGIASRESVEAAFMEAVGSPAFTGFLILGQTIFSFFMGINWRGGMALQRERWYGTLELVMLAPTSRVAWVLGESLFGLVDTGWTVFLAMVIAFWIFGVSFHVAHPEAVALALALTLAAMVALGVFFAGFYVLTRAAGPLSQAIQAPIRFLSGAQFPLRALPAAVATASYAIPVTYGLHAVRRSLLSGAGLAELRWDLLALAGATLLFFGLGSVLIRAAERRAKRAGTLHVY